MKKRRLSRRMLTALAAFAILIIAVVSVQLYHFYKQDKLEDYRESAYAYARTASDFIDGDRVLGYVETGQKDAYYEEIQKFFDDSRKEAGMKYYYVFVPYEEDLVYVWDGVTEEQSQLGDREEYMNEYSFNAVKEEFTADPPQKLYVTDSDVYGFIATAYYPIYNSKGTPVAVVGVDLSVSGIYETIRDFTFIIIWTVVAITILGGLFYYQYLKRKVVKPLSDLNDAAKEMVTGLDQAKDFKLDIHTGDELEELSGSFKTMYVDLQEYIEKVSLVTAEKERIGAELNVATSIQRGMLPQIFPAFPQYKTFDVYATMDPAKEVGGDFYDFFLIDDNRLGLVIADVSGKGVPAALFMVIAKTLIKNRMQMGELPAQALMNVNNQLCEGNEAELFVTVWLALIDLETGHVIEANAGHEYPAIRRSGECFELVKTKHSPAVATFEGIKYRQDEFDLNPGDSLFVYTDGVTEATNSNNELFGEERLLTSINKNKNSVPVEILPELRKDIDEFVGTAPQFDDITMMGFKFLGTNGANQSE